MTNSRLTIVGTRIRRASVVRSTFSLLSALVAIGTASNAAQAAPKEVGIWYDDTGRGAVQIYKCGSKLCGRIVWLKDPLGKDGQPLSDGYNPRASLRTRPICGLQVLGDLAPQGDGSWDEGWVYDPKVGQQYDAAIALTARNSLILTGYKGIKLLSKSFKWTRAPDSLPTCSTSDSASR